MLTHPGLIAINQDPLGRPARLTSVAAQSMTWVRELSSGGLAVAVLNHSDSVATVDLSPAALRLPGCYQALDVIAARDLGDLEDGLKVPLGSHETLVLRLSPSGDSRIADPPRPSS
ncbi:hypothetical protein OO014_13180 [Intrasporangium calvum]|uniref:Alpha galactosidase C-terminal domain-containing protein n=1 Tax=Intrasporangium calvum TaxID=53358 RepID=A0ABT5GIZ8_9MICO|nr:hypothetical protein [Intrasporangium calvum]MDC5698213.1 hypothetical protein [Intrasporangium calvum]